ncbi:uncharacterized protein LOC119083419 [Bradysia coprophila]|uniref:uncharacterized protein LOC119083419 n=1 Tax=Bradysia coprophila TaxID=38358 RepID=UPI00187D7D1D|nr:uncharacterized protein LOC119083419 [Bradysia coprophila]
MNFHQIFIVINVVSSSVQQQEIVLINRLNDFFKFDHNIFLIDSSVDAERFMHPVNQRDIVPISSYRFKFRGDEGIEGLDRLTRIDSKYPLMIIVVGSGALEGNGNSSLPARFVQMHRLQRNMKIGFFISRPFAGDGVLQKLFRWCWNHGLTNIFVATFSPHDSAEPFNLFKFDPFVQLRVINITGISENESVGNVFPNKKINFQLHPLRFTHQYVVTPIATEMQQIFSRAMNATKATSLGLNDTDIIPMLNIFLADWNDKIAAWRGLSLYPITMSTFVLVVPEALPFPSFSSYLKTISSDSLFGWSIAIIVLLVMLLTVTRYKKRDWNEIFGSAVDVVNLLMGDNLAIRYQKLLPAEATLIIALTFVGFFMVNGLSSTYQSFYTQPIMQQQINTIDGLYQSPIPIFVTPGYWENEILNTLNDQFKRRDWRRKIRSLNTSDLNREIFLRNSSISFFTLDKGAKILIASQRRWGVRGYRVLGEATAFMKKLSSFYVNERFPFIDCANEIILRTQSAGLFKKWNNDEEDSRSKAVNIDLNKDSDTEQFHVPFFIVHGWIAGCVVFGVEIVWTALSPVIFRRLGCNGF